ncbi:DUF4340 domain-containing protein [Leptospira wolffii]|uniref:DUF4340 domain-containing protein n=1 Tax=Leptospira wolffii TaxID=409998 RepID=A0ABV5BN79_9LEPT
MRNKLLLLALVVVLLFASIFLLEENKEDLTEFEYWKLNIDKIEYFPGGEKWSEESGENFAKKPFEISKRDEIRKGNFYIVSDTDSETGKKIEYEAGYNAENSFRDLNRLKVKSTESVTEGIPVQESLLIGEDSPKLVLYSGNQKKVLRIGKKHKNGSTRVILDEGHPSVILSSSSYLFDRFQKGPEDFRQRQLINLNGETVKEISYLDETGKSIRMDNTPYEDNKAKKNFWRRLSGTIMILDQKLAEDLYRSVTGLKTELFPDEPNGAGFAVSNLLAPDAANTEYSLASLKVILSDGNEILIRFHRSTDIGERKLNPVVRILNRKFQEPPVYVNEDIFHRIQDTASRIQASTMVAKPSKKTSAKPQRKNP